MKNFFIAVLLILYIIVLASCAGQEKPPTQPVPDYIADISQDVFLMIDDITDTKDGAGNKKLPEWLTAYFIGGDEEIEKMNPYRYSFVIVNEGGNFGALNKWADNYSITQDFSRMAAARIEKRIFAETLFPDDVYGRFYETLIKKTFSAEYSGASIEDTYWIKSKIKKDSSNEETYVDDEIYEFFIFIRADKTLMQRDINKMMTETLAAVTTTRAQKSVINRLIQNFFTGF